MSGAAYDAELIDSHLSDLRTLAGYSVHVARFPPAPLSILQERTGMAYSSDDISSVQDKGPPKAHTDGPFLRFSASYCFGAGSAAKFAWTNIHLSPFFT